MHSADIAVGEALGGHFEQARSVELGEDGADAHGRLHIAPLLHVMDGVVVIEHEHDARLVTARTSPLGGRLV